MSPMTPPCDTVFPGTPASAWIAVNGADSGKVYRSSDDARAVLLRSRHAAHLSMLSRMYLYMCGQWYRIRILCKVLTYSTQIGGHQVDLSEMMRICDVVGLMVR
jgi:hypothetical protein